MSAASTTVSTGGRSYSVSVAKPNCRLTQNVATPTLDPTKENDRPCFGQSDTDKLVTSTDTLTSAPSGVQGPALGRCRER